jgi:excisionase family DNA binding protein
MERSQLLSVAEAAAHLGVAEAFVRRLVLQRRVRFYKVGRYVRFRVADLNAFVEAGRQDPVAVDVHVLAARRDSVARANSHRRAAGSGSGGVNAP